ncbi:type IV pilus modification PilV family protein [Alkalihalobacterium sp. APHAB7]|uniref:type IV pilus modification PilV family protein n=1 Tax=Alkalihalobacterium sp. APHAB7 TaxID=3402081 RepID=UPI003AAF5647
MNNQEGMTLVELLVAIVIAGLILVPLLHIMTGTFTRTHIQGDDTQHMYFAQEVMENIRNNGYTPGDPTKYYCLNDLGCIDENHDEYDNTLIYDGEIEVIVEEFSENNNFYEVLVQSLSSNSEIKFYTVVKKQ